MVRIAGCAVSDYLCIDLRAALFRMLQLLKYENAGALAHDETVPVFIKRNRSPQRIFRLGKCGQCRKACHADRRNCALRAACHTDVRVVVLNCAEGIANAVRSCRTRRYHAGTFSFRAECNRNVSRRHVRNHHRNGKRVDAGRISGINFGFRLLACIQITDAGAHQNADAERIFILHGNAGICKRFFCCRNGILGESSHSSCRLEIHAFFCHEAFDLACQMYFIFCCIKFRNRSDSAGSLADAVPEFLHGISNRGYRTQPCDDYSSLHSNSPFLRSPCRRRSESPVR